MPAANHRHYNHHHHRIQLQQRTTPSPLSPTQRDASDEDLQQRRSATSKICSNRRSATTHHTTSFNESKIISIRFSHGSRAPFICKSSNRFMLFHICSLCCSK
ncbi:hypothetical protein Hanom_Chr14g01323921 [Helianthus anomalus]